MAVHKSIQMFVSLIVIFGTTTANVTAQQPPEVLPNSMAPLPRVTPIDPERTRPPGGPSADDGHKEGTIEIYEHTQPVDYDHSIILQLPEKFRYGSSKGANKGWGANILTYYPSFTSPAEPENARFGLACAGDCNGRILISLENTFSSVTRNSMSWSDLMVRMATETYLDHQSANIEVVSEPSQFGFDHVFERKAHAKANSLVPLMPGAPTEIIDKYMYHTVPDGIHHDLYAKCSMWTTIHGCQLYFSSTCDPALAIQVGIVPFEKMETAFDVRDKVDRFVSAMIINRECH